MTVSEAGRKGGQARARNLTPRQLRRIAKMGYLASPISKREIKHDENEMVQKVSR